MRTVVSNFSSVLAKATWLCFALALLVAISRADEPALIDFVKQVRPILQKHCYQCHAEKKQKSSLRLDIKSQAFKGGEAYGPSIVAGEPGESPLIQFVADEDADLRMPPDGPPLSEKEIATLTTWVKQGAIWPAGVDLAKLEDRLDHWSFKPVVRSPLPTTANTNWPRNSIDRFVLRRLETAGMSPAEPADRRTWLRRVYFDLIGLPPTPADIEAFANDERPDAYQRVVDRLLASPQFGQRYGQHWLDLVRYADTHGFEVNTERPHAWPYRDYVIAAFNNDTPYDRFIREQLTGDALQQDAATGFLVTAAVLLPGQIGKDDASKRLARHDSLAEMIINTSDTFLGMSVGCARCHDHKFDPITQRDYYAMEAFFAGVQYGDRPMQGELSEAKRNRIQSLEKQLAVVKQEISAFESKTGGKLQSTNPKENVVEFASREVKFVRFTIHDANLHPTLGLIEPCIDEFEIFTDAAEPNNVALASAGCKVTASGSRTSALHKLEHVNDGEYGNRKSWMSSEAGRGWLLFELPKPIAINKIVWGRDRTGKYHDRLATAFTLEAGVDINEMQTLAHIPPGKPNDLLAKQKKLNDELAAARKPPMVYGGKFTTPAATHLLFRGDAEQPRDEIAPAVISSLGNVALPTDAAEQQRRKSLASWIADSRNPLTARVMVNRIWQWHFGVGLVATASDFGRKGEPPSHPELLNYLADEFVKSGWSMKQLHRQIVLSAAYRQSSQVNADYQQRDANVRLLWRFPSRRLEAETIRDAMLHVSGELNLQTGGRGFDLFKSRGGLNGFPPVESFPPAGLRRMIYAHKVRMERDVVFGAFDCPDAGQTTARRRQSTTPIQALNLFNSQFTTDRAEAFATRVRGLVGDDIERQIQQACLLAFGRRPFKREIQDYAAFVREHGLPPFCRVLLNSNEFLFLP